MASHEVFTKSADGTLVKQIFSAPVGAVIAYPVSAVPAHCLECNGAVISRATYPELFAVLGTTYGAGDGSTTFALPDFRDKFLRGASGSNAAAIGTAQGDAIRNITGSAGILYRMLTTYSAGVLYTATYGSTPAKIGTVGTDAGDNATVLIDASRSVPTAAENRPVNYSVKFCIVFE